MKRVISIACLLLLAFVANAQDTIVNVADSTKMPCHRPKVGIVLSGGGAKGFAHIGALRIIEEAGIPVDFIAGTSMGSIIGGLYAVGYDTETMEKLVNKQNWDRIIKDNIPRKFIPIEKRVNDRHYLFTLPFKDGNLKIKRSMVDGMYVNMLLTRLTLPAYKHRDFSKLPVPFLCVATDMISSDPIVFTDGSLSQAIRSSMSIPFLFEPVEYNNYLLVDGGLTNNFPVRNLRKMGADIIIGVDLEIIKSDHRVLDNSLKVLERLIAVVSQGESNKAREDCDILIRPDIGNANIMSFEDFDPIIKCGERGAEEKFPELKRLADSLQAICPFEVERFHTQPIDSIEVMDVVVEGVDAYDASVLRSEFGEEFPYTYSINDIETIIVKIYSMGYYSNVWYEIIDTPEGNILKFHCKNNTYMNLSLGMHYDNNYGIGVLLNMLAKSKHAYFNVDVNLSDNPYVNAGIAFRFNRFFQIGLDAKIMKLHANILSGSGSISNSIDFRSNSLNAYVQFVPNAYQMFRFGALFNYCKVKDLIDVEGDGPTTSKYFNPTLYFRYFMNNEDQTVYPTRGWNINLIGKFMVLDGEFKEANISRSIQADIRRSFAIGRNHSFKIGVAGMTRLGKSVLDDYNMFFIGGQSKMNYLHNIISFTGLPFVSVVTEHAAFAKTAWQWNFYNSFYAIANCDMGYMKNIMTMTWEDIENMFDGNPYDDWFEPDNYVMGVGLTLGYKTLIGPIEVELSKSNITETWAFFINVGYWF